MPLTAQDRGVFPIMITPFDENGAIDFGGVERLMDFYVRCGVPGVTVLGILGEPQKLTDAEQIALVRHVVRHADTALKVIVGAKQLSLEALASFAGEVMDCGAGGLMISPPGTIRHEEQLFGFFDHVTRRLGPELPIVLQDFPRQTGVHISVTSMNALIDRCPGIQVIKHEEDGALRKISRLRESEAKGRRRVAIWVGNSAVHLPQELARGADGANTGIGFPEILVETCRRHFAGDVQAAEDLYDAALPVIRHEHQPGVGLAIRKEIYRRRGIIACAALRAPGPALDATDHVELSALLARFFRRLDELGGAGLLHAPSR